MPWDSLVSRPISAARHHSMGWRWLLWLKDTARYASLLLAPAEGIGLQPFKRNSCIFLLPSCLLRFCPVLSEGVCLPLDCFKLSIFLFPFIYLYKYMPFDEEVLLLLRTLYPALSCPVPSMNIFAYLFNKYVPSNLDICLENYVASKYICIFVRSILWSPLISAPSRTCLPRPLDNGPLEKKAQKQPTVARWRCQST